MEGSNWIILSRSHLCSSQKIKKINKKCGIKVKRKNKEEKKKGWRGMKEKGAEKDPNPSKDTLKKQIACP